MVRSAMTRAARGGAGAREDGEGASDALAVCSRLDREIDTELAMQQ